MNEQTDWFDAVAQWVPESHQTSYWRYVAKLRHLKPDDDLLILCEGMGIHTYLIRQVPEELSRSLDSWKTELRRIGNSMETIAESCEQQSQKSRDSADEVKKLLGETCTHLETTARRMEEATQKAVNTIDLNRLQSEVIGRLERNVVKPLENSTVSLETYRKGAEAAAKSAKESIDQWHENSMWTVWSTAFLVCGLIHIVIGGVLYAIFH